MHLVLLETSGNQRYIFATNKLRENVGASELTYRMGTRLTLEAVESVTKVPLYAQDLSTLHANLLSTEKNPALEMRQREVEVILATSGKALLLVHDTATGQRIIHHVTAHALRHAPGLTVHGAISEPITLTPTNIHQRVGEVHQALEHVRYQVPGVEQRFMRLPFVAECATSGLPATAYDAYQLESGARSCVAMAKRNAASDGHDRMAAAVCTVAPQVSMPATIEALEQYFTDMSWLAVIHADGNGLGQLFLTFDKYVSADRTTCSGRDYLDAYRRFSLALDVCTVRAFGEALKRLHTRMGRVQREVPVVPLVLGGDDLTVVCDGEYAVRLTYDFLTAFEAETTRTDAEPLNGIIPHIAQRAFGVPRLSSCAGIAIVKSHFPFYAAYGLAEELLQSAKQVKQRVQHQHQGATMPLPCSALDYHVLYDTSRADLQRIRGQLQVDSGATVLVGRPYVVTPGEHLGAAQHDIWIAHRTWGQLYDRIEAVRKEDPASRHRRLLPNSMLHGLRESLFLGHQQADARMRLVRQRYRTDGFDVLLGDREGQGSLFWQERHAEQDGHTTGFLDALDLVGFWK
jgi:hypothetical protein